MLERSKECIAMLLAGGQGSRLKVLTSDIAKPAVSFGGKYKIIDFTLSNCINSNIDTVGILTQYEPLVLNSYIGNGQPWGLNRNYGGVKILPPYAKSEKSEWYKGTANAIYQNIHYIDMYNPKYVLILSGDHIYKMDYSKMLQYHKDKNADCTISVIDVPLSQTHRFGIVNSNEDNLIYEFEEKPKKAKSTTASMGIYIFNWQTLRDYLIADEQDNLSDNDFGKNVLPSLLKDGKKLYAYNFNGYWKDVGTLQSLWEANMDLLKDDIDFNLKDANFKIYTKNYAKPPSFISHYSNIKNSIIAEGCTINGYIENSIIFSGCVIEKDCVIKNSIIMPNTVVEKNCQIDFAIVGENCLIKSNSTIGEHQTEDIKISVVGTNRILKESSIVLPKQIV